MIPRNRWCVAAAVVLAVPCAAQAQTDTLRYEYAVKVMCGGSASGGSSTYAASGIYYTAVNVHNPANRLSRFRVKTAYTSAIPERAGPVTRFTGLALAPDSALRIDCSRVQALSEPGFTATNPFDGFVVIQSTQDLDVVAVYSASAPNSSGLLTVTTMDVERVQPRPMRVIVQRAALTSLPPGGMDRPNHMRTASR